MKKIACALLLLWGLAPRTAEATTYIAASSAQLDSINNVIKPGDTVQINDGTYTVAPIPWQSGTSSSRIRYIGNTANPSAVIVAEMVPAGCSYVTWNGMNFNGALKIATYYTFQYASPTGDSVIACRAYSGECGMSGTTDCTFKGDTLGDNVHDCNFVIKSGEIGNNCVNPHLVSCIMYVRGTNPTDANKLWVLQGVSGPATSITGMVMTGTKVTGTFTGTAQLNGFFCVIYYLDGFTWANNKFNVYDSTATGMNTDLIAYLWRDGFVHGTFTSDTFLVTKGTNVRWEISSSGNNLIDTGHRKFTNCVFRNLGSPKSGLQGSFHWQNGIVADTLQGCLFAAKDTTQRTILVYDIYGGASIFDHCTIIHSPNFGAISREVTGAIPSTGSISIRNCLFHSNSLVTSSSFSSIYVNVVGSLAQQYIRDYNLYAYKGKTSTLGDRTIRWTVNNGASQFSQPGTSGQWYLNYGQDAHSKWGYSMMTASDTTSADSGATNGSKIKFNSAAAFADEFGGDIGSFQRSTDTTRPAAISDFTVTSQTPNSVTLQWTATGDDSLTGTAKTYTIVYSTSNITSGNFSSATVWPQTMAPAAVGTAEITTISGLLTNTTYYFAIKATDEAGNPSAISNIASAELKAPAGPGRIPTDP